MVRATETDVAAWRLPQSAKAALIFSGVPLLDELAHEVCAATWRSEHPPQ